MSDKNKNKVENIMIDLNTLAQQAYLNAKSKGFHDKELSDHHYKMLIITELAEVIEADRSNKVVSLSLFQHEVKTAQLNPDKHFVYLFNTLIKSTIEEELADVVIRALDYAGVKEIKLQYSNTYAYEMQQSCTNESLIESIFNITKYVTEEPMDISKVIHSIFGLAMHYKINLLDFILLKMKYNKLRDKMHNKKY